MDDYRFQPGQPPMYMVYDKDGKLLSGDANLDQGMRDYADEHQGYIKLTQPDGSGDIVHQWGA